MRRHSFQSFRLVCIALACCVVISIPLMPLIAYGADGFVPLADIQGSAKFSNLYAENEGALGVYLNRIFLYIVSLGALLAILRLVWAGYLYMSSDMFGKKEHAKEVISDAILGLLLLLSVWIILNQINPQILELNVDAPSGNPAADLLEQYKGDTQTAETDYITTFNPTPLSGYYCFPRSAGYGCLTSETNCNRVAQGEGKSCSFFR